MQQLLRGMMAVFLCCAAGAVAGEAPPDARLREAQAALDEANTLGETGRYAEAITRGEHALEIQEAVLGKDHPEVARTLDTVANLYLAEDQYDRAEPLYVRALAIREAALGRNHPLVAETLRGLAAVYVEQGSYARARPLFQRALEIRESALTQNPPDVAEALTELATLYLSQRWPARARPLLERALAVREAALGREHPLVADSLYELATLYGEQGLYGRAEPLLERALAIREASLGRNHLEVAETLIPLSHLYMAQGLYARAEPLLERTLAIRQAAFGEKNSRVAWTLIMLGNLYRVQGLYARAEPLLRRALVILEAVCGRNHPLVADAFTYLARLYQAQGLYARAEPLLRRSLTILEASLGKNHPGAGTLLDELADLASAQGAYGRAGLLYERALAIQEATLDPNHPNIAETLNGLAGVRLAQRRRTEALPLLTRAFTMTEQRLRQESLGFSEARLATFLEFLRGEEERLYALLRAYPEDARVRRLALAAALLLKGRSVEETAEISRTVYRSLGAQDRDAFERLRELRTQLAQLSLEGPGALSPAAYRQRIEELSEQGASLEADLARRSAPLRALATLPPPAEIVDRVAAALPGDAALVEFIAYADRRSGQLRYLALVLFPDASTRALDLGPAEPIDLASSRLRDALADRDVAFLARSQELYQLAFRPLLPLLGRTHRLFLSPDGQLALVPFAALHDGHQFLIDTFDFTYLSSGRSLLPRSQDSAPPGSVVVLAAPDFGAAPRTAVPSETETSEPAEHSASIERFFSTRREDLARRAWAAAPLPGTRQEAEAIQHLIPQAQLFLGPEATKERLLHLSPPGILHLATHGFFLEDSREPAASRAIGHFGALGEDMVAQRPADPLLRSGLVFAGARPSATASSGSSKASMQSALVTALELAGLDLWGTQLVVLSACDTGRGDVKLGQGVYGLRRAFLVAGAETVVMSLWKVDDETTRALMEAYYRHLLAGEGRATALREAMLELRQTQPHPHFWAPFIAMGQDAPLRLLAPRAF